MSDYENHQLKDIKARHFTGPTSEIENGFRTIPNLLRAIADWMDEQDLQDPEFDNLVFHTSFVHPADTNGDDPYYETATLYYLGVEDER